MSGESKWVKFVQQVSILQQSSAGSSITHCSLSLHILITISDFALFSFLLPNYVDQTTTPTGNGWSGSIPKEVYILHWVQQKMRDFLSVSCGEYGVPYWGSSIRVTPNDWSQRLALWLTANWTLLKMWWWGDHWTICYPLWKILATRSTTY